MIVRRDAKDLKPKEKTAFTNAVLALKAKPSRLHPTDKTRGRYDDFVETHLDAMMAMSMGHVPNWGHQSSAFCAWHRVLLYHFESELRAIDSSVTLPYWDWTDADSTSAVFSSGLLGGNGRSSDGQVTSGPFAFSKGKWKVVVKDEKSDPDFLARQFGADPSATALPTAADQKAVIALTEYDESPWYDTQRKTAAQRKAVDKLFRFRLEYDLHNLVHRYIGGDMGLASSPNDPVFWLHHCNLDRLWSLWESAQPAANVYAPMHGGPDGQSGDKALIYAFANSTPPWIGATKPEDVYDSRGQIGIGYATDPVATHLAVSPPDRMTMPMSPEAMYPLRKEFHDASAAREMFPLRSEFKAASPSVVPNQKTGRSR